MGSRLLTIKKADDKESKTDDFGGVMMYGLRGTDYMSFAGYSVGRTSAGTVGGRYSAGYSWEKAVQNAAEKGNESAAVAAGKTKALGSRADGGRTENKVSAVEEYKRRHPEDAAHVDQQVQAGKRVLSKNGADEISRDEMSMEEYKIFIEEIMAGIPFDSSRTNDREIVSISEAGWEQMKNDPDYEAWVLGYTSENRAVRNPFAAWTGGIFAVERFGASIESHHGESVSMSKADEKEKEDGKSWWQKRHERYEELLEQQVKASIAKRGLMRAKAQENLLRRTGRNGEEAQMTAAFAAYEASLMTPPLTGSTVIS